MPSTRRQFLAAAAAGAAALSSAHAHTEDRPLRLGVIGVGWYGMVDAKAALKVGGVEIAAICDVDSEHLDKSAAELEKLQGKCPRTFKLYEDMLAQQPLDAVIIATPPQWHALQFIAALEKGLDIYQEKPIAYDVREGRAMVEAARKHPQRVVQVGFQRRQSKAMQEAKQFIDAGGAGRLVQVDVQIHYKAATKDPTAQQPPASLDWDLWCGPGPKIPYSPQVSHHNWRLEKTSGHGHLVDWGIHLIDACRVVLGESLPRQVTAAGGLYFLKDQITTPDTLTAHFEFARCPVVWRHRLWGAAEYAPEVNNGIFFYGEKATVFATDAKWIVIPQDKDLSHNRPSQAGRPSKTEQPTGSGTGPKKAQREEHEVKSDAGLAHMADFLGAVRARRQPACTIEDAYRSTATVQLAMIAYETNSVVRWDAQREEILDNPAASKLLAREYRAPWKRPG